MQLEPKEPEFFECGDVLASDRGIIETEMEKQMQIVPRESIKHIALRYGSPSHRPTLEFIVGLALTGVGVYDLGRITTTGKFSRWDIGILTIGLIGASLIYSVARKCHYLYITTASTHFKVRFSPDTSLSEIKVFCAKVERRWEYEMSYENVSGR